MTRALIGLLFGVLLGYAIADSARPTGDAQTCVIRGDYWLTDRKTVCSGQEKDKLRRAGRLVEE